MSQNAHNGLTEAPSLVVAAHEIKAPLSLMRQLSLILRDEPQETPLGDDDVQRLLQRMTLTAERSLRLVEMVTKHARLEEGLFELEPIHVGRICEEVAHEISPLCQALQRRIEVKVARRPLLAVANRDLLKSIVFGLCDNALAYGGDKHPIVMGTTHYSNRVRIAVRDDGPRLAGDVFRDLESKLGRAAQPISGRPESSGLGLYVAGQFAAVMHGSLGVQRHKKSGTTFYVETPASAQLSFMSV